MGLIADFKKRQQAKAEQEAKQQADALAKVSIGFDLGRSDMTAFQINDAQAKAAALKDEMDKAGVSVDELKEASSEAGESAAEISNAAVEVSQAAADLKDVVTDVVTEAKKSLQPRRQNPRVQRAAPSQKPARKSNRRRRRAASKPAPATAGAGCRSASAETTGTPGRQGRHETRQTAAKVAAGS